MEMLRLVTGVIVVVAPVGLLLWMVVATLREPRRKRSVARHETTPRCFKDGGDECRQKDIPSRAEG